MASPVFRLMDLPQELRDEIYGKIIELDYEDRPFLFRKEHNWMKYASSKYLLPKGLTNATSQYKKPACFDILKIPTLGSDFRTTYMAKQPVRVPRSQIMDYVNDWCVKTGIYRGKILVDVCDHCLSPQDLKPVIDFCLKYPGVEIIFGNYIGGASTPKSRLADILNAMVRSKNEQWSTMVSDTIIKVELVKGLEDLVRMECFALKIYVKDGTLEPWMCYFNGTFLKPRKGRSTPELASTMMDQVQKFGLPYELGFFLGSCFWRTREQALQSV